MDRKPQGQSTAPSAESRQSERAGQVLAVRWVFPTFERPATRLGAKTLSLGRGEECDAHLPGTETSRLHAEIRHEGPIFIVRDLGSTNGVHLNARRIQEGPLSKGDVLRLGEWVGVLVDLATADTDSVQAFGTLADGLYGGPTLRTAIEPARRAASSELPLVVEGETGTGKERVARAVHSWSRRNGPFVAVNCAAVPESLAEAELFGYRRGAFTGADRSSPGHFRTADGGTLLLDEIGDLSLAVQAKLLRVLEQCEVMPLGESRPVPVHVRVIAASQDSMMDRVKARSFRADLYARLEGLTIRIPPLRERIDEVPYLFAQFLNDHSGGRFPGVDARLIEALCLYDWPFNVRELDLVVRRLLTLHGHEKALHRAALPDRLLATVAGTTVAVEPGVSHAQRRDRELAGLLDALREHKGNLARAAASVGISRQRAYRLLETSHRFDLEGLRAGADAHRNDSRIGGNSDE